MSHESFCSDPCHASMKYSKGLGVSAHCTCDGFLSEESIGRSFACDSFYLRFFEARSAAGKLR